MFYGALLISMYILELIKASYRIKKCPKKWKKSKKFKSENFFCLKILLVQFFFFKNVGSKKFCSTNDKYWFKIFWSKHILGQRILVLKNFGAKTKLGSKRLVKENLSILHDPKSLDTFQIPSRYLTNTSRTPYRHPLQTHIWDIIY